MRIALAVLFASFITVFGCLGQRNVYIYKAKPTDFVGTDLFSGKNVCLTIKDKRVIDAKTKVKFTFEEFAVSISETLKKACPKATFTDTEDGADILLSIDVERYDVRFTGVIFTGITRYNIHVKPTGGDTSGNVVEGLCTRGNILGTSTAKSVIQKSFDDASRKLLDYLMKSQE